MVTIKDVARIAGVSTATVSRVIHNGSQVGDACRARVKKVIAELGYQPNANAQALVSKTTNTIGVVTPRLSMSFFGTLASGVENAVRENGYKLLMANSLYETQSELDAIQSLRQHNCQAIILHSEYSDEATLIRLAAEIPGLVLVNRYIPQIANRCVWLDNIRGGQWVTEYLCPKATAICRHYQYLSKPRSSGALKGSRQALLEQGLSLPQNWWRKGPLIWQVANRR
ncbi:MAG: LacI family transcriptional regulator [Shewanella fodinae]|nr:LacI family transcriptional regulator [Shewanella fodinae]